MKYKVTHTTTYDYAETVALCQNEVHLIPRSGHGQTCTYHRLIVQPVPATTDKRTDYFGNAVTYFSINVGHRRLRVTAVSKVVVDPPPLTVPADSPPWEQVRDGLANNRSREGLEAYQFVFDSPLVSRFEELGEYARPSFPTGRPLVEAVLDLTSRIHADFKYETHSTTVSTPVDDVFRNRRGVCQDLAHVQISCLRSLGMAARYVSGYLRTVPPEGTARLVGADASHAWLSVYGGPLGWIDVDPTNNVQPSTDHITLAWGRDYSDVCPIHGMFVGGGQHVLSVSVDVVPL